MRSSELTKWGKQEFRGAGKKSIFLRGPDETRRGGPKNSFTAPVSQTLTSSRCHPKDGGGLAGKAGKTTQRRPRREINSGRGPREGGHY